MAAEALNTSRIPGRRRALTMIEPCHDIAHLGHVELLTPALEQSLAFFVDVMGMTESGRDAGSVYLRAFDDYEFHTLKLTAAELPGMGHAAFRASSPQALARRVQALEARGCGRGWHDGDLGHGRAFRAQAPDGHLFEIYYDTRRYEPPPGQRPALKNQAQRFPARGVNVRRLDHLNLLALDVTATRQFLERGLGMRTTERIVLDDGTEAGAWLTATNKSYDIAFTKDHTSIPGRFHHLTYAVDCREDVLRAADIFLEAGTFIETGPHKHAIQQTFFLYVYEPGGNRVEVANAGARLVLAPDWQPIVWSESERAKGQAWGLKTVESFHTYGTPPHRTEER
jgi:catechol 2,3-dioxygenase